jgi:hypothetical protein
MPVTLLLYFTFGVTDTKMVGFIEENSGCTLSIMDVVAGVTVARMKRPLKKFKVRS